MWNKRSEHQDIKKAKHKKKQGVVIVFFISPLKLLSEIHDLGRPEEESLSLPASSDVIQKVLDGFRQGLFEYSKLAEATLFVVNYGAMSAISLFFRGSLSLLYLGDPNAIFWRRNFSEKVLISFTQICK